jgi:hypothetical protein
MPQRELFDDITLEGGDGSSPEKAIIIKGARSHATGVLAEYEFLEKQFGIRGVDWKFLGQSLLVGPAERMFDQLKIELADGRIIIINCDITEYYRMLQKENRRLVADFLVQRKIESEKK